MKLVFMGSPLFAVPALEALVAAGHEIALVVTQPDKPAGRGRKLSAPAVKQAAEKLGLSVIQPKSARTPEFSEAMRATGAELAVVVAYGKILPLSVLEAFPKGCINIHGSLLPAWRGAAPIQRAIMNGDAETGISIMQLDEGMDTGPVYAMRTLTIGPTDTSGSLAPPLAALGAELLVESLPGIADGSLEAKAQDDSLATHAAMLKKEDGAIDWSLSAAEVSARMRGVFPWPGSYAMLGEARIKLFGPSVVAGEGAPGTVLAADGEGIVVACGQDALKLEEAQAPGKKRSASADFARGYSVVPGTVFASG